MDSSCLKSDRAVSVLESGKEGRGAIEFPASLRASTLCIMSPMANERENCVEFINAMLAAAEGFKEVTFLAILDRASKDGTVEVLREFEKVERRFRLVWAPENRGVVDAYMRGYREALATGTDWILEIDAGFSHKPGDFRQFFQPMADGFDVVFGSRFCKGGKITDSSWKRWMVSKGGTILTNAMLGTNLYDMTSGYQCFTRGALTKILERGVQSRSPFFQTEMKVHARDMKTVEVPIHYSAASHNVGGSSIKDSFRQLARLRRELRAGR